MRTLLALVAAGVLLAPAPALAQEDVEGAKDHPMLSRFPGYFISDYDEQEFGAFEFTLAGDKTRAVEGRYWKINYTRKEEAKRAGPVEIARNYINAIVSRGGVREVEQVDVSGGFATIRLPAGGKNIWVEVSISNSGEYYALTIVEEAGMAQKVEFTAMELSKILDEKGSVALYGILFDTGKSTIKPESAALLAQVGDLLKQDPGLKLEIQGHTDNVGAKAANQKLSEDRAAAVKDYLVKKLGVDAARLTTAGFGDTKPVADNSTEQGRAQNRRVELVKK